MLAIARNRALFGVGAARRANGPKSSVAMPIRVLGVRARRSFPSLRSRVRPPSAACRCQGQARRGGAGLNSGDYECVATEGVAIGGSGGTPVRQEGLVTASQPLAELLVQASKAGNGSGDADTRCRHLAMEGRRRAGLIVAPRGQAHRRPRTVRGGGALGRRRGAHRAPDSAVANCELTGRSRRNGPA
jgi:hypothetical protein